MSSDVKDERTDERSDCQPDSAGKVQSDFETEAQGPSLEELVDILNSAPRSCRHSDEVWPNLYLGDMYMSHDKFGLWQLGITHVLNAAHGKMCCKGSDDFYGTTVKYHGVPANDLPTFDLSPFFHDAALFIHDALAMSGNGPQQDLALIKELEKVLDSCTLELSPIDEVWPNLYIGNVAIAQNRSALRKMGITHVLNAAHSKQGSIGDQDFYGSSCVYWGVPAEDSKHFDLGQHFTPAADFIHKALKSKDGKVLVHCIMGISRSATLVLAFLMLRRHLSLANAVSHVIQSRAIFPNRNFLSLLLQLDQQLASKRSTLLVVSGKWTMSSCVKTRGGGNPYKAVRVDPDSDYITPGTLELEQMFWVGAAGAQYTHFNEVWPSIYIGDEKTALERAGLKSMGVTHILNAAEGKWNNVLTGAEYYRDDMEGVQYYGVEADDKPTFNISQFFHAASHFIHGAVRNPPSKVLVHCVMGRSRSASLVLAYLMMEQGLSVVDAIEHVRQRRCILPNHGFLRQLRALDIALQEERLRQKKTPDG
ncbi:hypothetical protein CRUP_018134 [Coryphaenoides rupestris]|nr:hypothetical protein CRUP_018134 [Coryphaenoides rupestris]